MFSETLVPIYQTTLCLFRGLCEDTFISSDCTVSRGRMIGELRDLEKSNCAITEVLSHHLPGGTEENYERLQTSVSRAIFEPETSGMRV
jgi:hypothetical protein